MKIDFIKSENKMSKAGKPYISVSVKSGEDWYNGFGKQGVTDKWKVGDIVDVVTYEEEYNGKMYKHFRLHTVMDRIDELEKRVVKLESSAPRI